MMTHSTVVLIPELSHSKIDYIHQITDCRYHFSNVHVHSNGTVSYGLCLCMCICVCRLHLQANAATKTLYTK